MLSAKETTGMEETGFRNAHNFWIHYIKFIWPIDRLQIIL